MVRIFCAAWLIAAAGGLSLLHAATSEKAKNSQSADLTPAIIGNKEAIPPVFHEEQAKPRELTEALAVSSPQGAVSQTEAASQEEPGMPPGVMWLAAIAFLMLAGVLVRVVRASDPEQRTERPRYGRALTS